MLTTISALLIWHNIILTLTFDALLLLFPFLHLFRKKDNWDDDDIDDEFTTQLRAELSKSK